VELHLDHTEPHILVCRESMEHEDGWLVPWPAPEGVTELIVFMLNVADLHAQCPPPVPRGRKGQNERSTFRSVTLGGGTSYLVVRQTLLPVLALWESSGLHLNEHQERKRVFS
jgi:hypothetical protein